MCLGLVPSTTADSATILDLLRLLVYESARSANAPSAFTPYCVFRRVLVPLWAMRLSRVYGERVSTPKRVDRVRYRLKVGGVTAKAVGAQVV